jgi:diacylglycerol kinase (ATP)
MRIALVHNKSAGSENHAAEEIEACLRRNGHEVVLVVAEPDDLAHTLTSSRYDLIAVAGGDGTVSRTACVVAGSEVPLAILPLGTANNTARALRIEGELDAVVRAWHLERQTTFNLATIVCGDDGEVTFSEAVGWGVFPEVITRAHETSSPGQRERALEHDRVLFQSVIERIAPRRYELVVDGERIVGDYLLVEVVNIPFIGPRLELSPNSDPSDAKLELVLAGDSDRAMLLELATNGSIDGQTKLPSRQVERVTVHNETGSFHRDGTLVASPSSAKDYAIAIAPASVKYLLPRD